ncbi:M48 family metalloprotease [Amycolatopsis sp. FU40]|uniref:M48 family metalloprotease n=1 Tax=Amycolatopsis sp. FU40 TaxID=2914159 RepID=UPI001F0134D9|nr:M48 family metalloprotease [Amycolatopsis sp. FU40]UKD58748.1 M48 family metalloprotease [Amycolatopsis sp. FU40]
MLSEGLAKDLSETELAAVVDHERSHLRGRHHRLAGFAHAVSAALSFVPLARRSPEFAAAAVELSADAAAGRRHGAATVSAALDRMHPVRSADTSSGSNTSPAGGTPRLPVFSPSRRPRYSP